jgi:iron complex outermembrane receptor protein
MHREAFHRVYLFVGLAACGILSHAAMAAAPDVAGLSDMSLDDLLRIEVVGASRYAQPLADTPASVTVIGEDELRLQSYRNLAEALSSMRGVYTSNDRNYTYLGVRGFNRPGDYNSRILLLTDGARRNDALFDQAQIGNEAPIEIDWIKRLEFVSGPASAVYGANALFGIANAVLLDGGDVNGARVTLDAGSGNSQRLGLVAGQRVDGERDWFFGFAAYGAQGQDLYQRQFDNGTTDGWARGLDGEKYQKAYGKFRSGNWRLTGSFSTRDKDIPNAPYSTVFGEKGTKTVDQHGLLELAYEGDIANGWQQQFRVFNGSYRYDGNYRYAGALDNRDEARANWLGGDYRLSYTGIPQHKLMFGTEAQWNRRLLQRNFDVSPYRQVLDSNSPSHTAGFFIQDEWRIHPQWLLNLGVRYDKHSDYAAITSPRVALIYQPSQRLALKAMASSAWRAPNAYERFYDDGGILQKPAIGLQPERIRSTELAADFRIGESGRAGISLYRNQMHDMIDQVNDPADNLLVFRNQAEVRAHGVEVDGENRWSGGYRLRGSLAWQQSTMADGSGLVNSPRLLAKLIFGIPVAYGWTAGGEWLAMSNRRSQNGTVPGYGVTNLTLSSATIAKVGRFSLGVYNAANRRYLDPASSSFTQDAIEQDRRHFRLRWILAL